MVTRRKILVLAAIACIAPGFRTQAQNLSLGDQAPKLEVSSFVKGEAVSNLEPGKFYVVEFWATWCGPCRATIPHLTELQKKHPEVTFIGVSVWEQDQKLVKPFVDEMGDKMSYRVAMDVVPEGGKGGEGKMAAGWMKAAGQDGIPTAFIINKDNKIAWIGHPASMDEPLEKIVTGSWDIQAAIAEHKKALEAREAMMKIQTKIGDARKSGDPKKLIAVIDEVGKEHPALANALGSMKFEAMLRAGDCDKAIEFGKDLLNKVYGENANALNNLAWIIVDPDAKDKRDPKVIQFAVEVAERADQVAKSKEAPIADTLAKAYFDAGQKAKAVETQERAVKLAKGTQFENDKGLQSRLDEYRKAAKD